jgi:hypothetical protein
MSKPSPDRYRTTNWSSYNDALRKHGSLLIWLEQEMTWLAPHKGRPGRPPVFSNSAIEFCLSIKVLFKLPLWQTAGTVASLLHLAGLVWPVSYFATLCRREKSLDVQIPYRRADGPLNLLVPSRDIASQCPAGQWTAPGSSSFAMVSGRPLMHGVQVRRQWRKVHLALDAATSDIGVVGFTSSRDGDSPVLPELLDQTPKDE